MHADCGRGLHCFQYLPDDHGQPLPGRYLCYFCRAPITVGPGGGGIEILETTVVDLVNAVDGACLACGKHVEDCSCQGRNWLG